ncbi:MAG TPA: DEAD/DEAH box helicase [Chloroflexia bacterium]|nr:DEAD/DEAH box helicase [Chloroflexia bacterium]
MTGRKRTDAEEVADLPEELPQHDFGGLGTMIAREVAIEARRARARREFFRIEQISVARTTDDGRRTTKDEAETNPKSEIRNPKFLGMYHVMGENKREYSVLIRDPDPEHHVNRCSCLDYESNNLGTCKHIEAVLGYIRRKHGSALRSAKPRLLEVNRMTVYVTLQYVGDGTWTAAPVYDHKLDPGLLRLVNHYLMPYLALLEDEPDTFLVRLQRFVREVEEFEGRVVVEPEVYDYVQTVRSRGERDATRRELLAKVEAGEARLDLLNLPLYPYQAVGTLFLAFTEKALLADDLGLGKTPQALAAAKLLREWHGINRVLVVTPASVKPQWGREIERFTDDSYVVVSGSKQKRAEQYAQGAFFTVVNYELFLRDLEHIHALGADLVVLDEAQRIKNWRAKTSQAIKELPRKFAFVLTGTPLENRLEELYSIVEFLDDKLLGPPWQFMAQHVIQDEWGGIIGYKDLEGVRRAIAPILLRRRKADVLADLPERIDNDFWLSLETEQERVYRPLEKRLTELLRLPEWGPEQSAMALSLLTHLREAATAAQLVDPNVTSSSKLRELPALVEEIASEGHKMLIFSQWERMTRHAEAAIAKLGVRGQGSGEGIRSVRLHGGLGMRARQRVIEQFTNDPRTMVFISTDAGGLGLNLQAASFVINLDLPWNPAKVEQRIGRAHRIGQTQPVNVINMIAQDTIEQRVLDVLYGKQALFEEILDVDLDPETGTLRTGDDVELPADRLRRIVEMLLG